MKPSHIQLGEWGEEQAMQYFKVNQPDWILLEQNWKFKKSEVDLIYQSNQLIIFVEVKTRSTDYFGFPEESVTAKKKDKLAEAANEYINRIDHHGEIRFDILSIIKTQQQIRFYHIPDAFFPGLG